MGGPGVDRSALERRLGHTFADSRLLAAALTHASTFEGRPGGAQADYQRLEFLGDRVLGLIVADMLYRRFAKENEGELSPRHTALVRKETLARVAAAIGLGDWVVLSPSEEESGGRANPAILADVCEAVLGALYLDGGLETARAFVVPLWTPLMDEDPTPPKDAKTALQELVQARGRKLPRYSIVKSEGPSHAPLFTVAVAVEGLAEAQAEGTSRKAAEQAAARAMLERLR